MYSQAGDEPQIPELRLVAWEITRACNLACKHCRARAQTDPFPGQLCHEESLRLIDSIANVGRPILIFTGGEPLLRKDVFYLAEYAGKKGLKPVMAPNGTLINPENAAKMKASGIERVSISIDGPDARSHDLFRGVEGAFKAALQGIKYLQRAGVEFQINTTVTRSNLHNFRDIFHLAEDLGAVAWHIFMLVPTGRGEQIRQEIISAQHYEQVLNWLYDFRKTTNMHLKATCAPHYHRILRQRARQEEVEVSFKNFGLDAVSRGCLGGIGFCFISHSGQVQPCGYLELDCGQVREQDFAEIWQNSKIFNELRNKDCYRGKCAVCEYHQVCGGCRARAQAMNGHYLEEEPLCTYIPRQRRENKKWIVQTEKF